MLSKKRAATLVAPIATTLLFLPVLASERLDQALESVTSTVEEVVTAVQPQYETRWAGTNFTDTETYILNFLQDRGITDRAALATIMGNIRQESLFQTTICEGGAKTGYAGCRRGGFGLIQWTTIDRYSGLGNHAKTIGGNPNDLDTQLSWMIQERQWKSVEHIWKTPNQSIGTYMNAAYKWLGWGIHGNRTNYANQYFAALTEVQVPVQADT